MIIGLGWMGWTYKNNITQAKQSQEKANQGTTVKYEQGEVSESEIGGGVDYTNKLLPKFKVKTGGDRWRVSEDNKSTDSKLNLIALVKNSEDTLVISAYSNNGGLAVGANCFAKDDLVDIGSGWIRERILNETGSDQIGIVYVRKDRYTFDTMPEFDALHAKYLKYRTDNKLPILPKEKSVACGTAPRVNVTQTTIKTNVEKNAESGIALLRFSVNDNKIKPERLKIIDAVIINTEF